MEALDTADFENKIYYILCQVTVLSTAALVKETCITYFKKKIAANIYS